MSRWSLFVLLFALLVAPVAAQVIPSGPVGALNYWGVGGLSQVLNPGLAGQCLTTQGVGSAPVWVNCQVSSLSLLPPINTNQFYGNVSGQFAPPVGVDVNTILNTVGYDIVRPPTPESIIYKSNVGPTFNWQALPPGLSGNVLTSGGPTNPPFWAPLGQAALTAICSTVGATLYFDTPSLQWKCLAPGTLGQVLQTGGASANPSWLTLSGTAPLSYSNGTFACVTCATTTNGGALSASAPIVLSATGAISMNNQGTTTTVLHGNAAGSPAFSALVNADLPANPSFTSLNFTGGYLNAGTTPIEFDISKNCTVDPTGTNDMGACINSTISDAVTALTVSGGLPTTGAAAYVKVPCGTFKISTQVVFKSFVKIVGGGRGCTVFNVAVNQAFASNVNHQMIFSGLSGLSIHCSAGCTNTWTGLQLYSVQASDFSDFEISGFSGTGAVGINITPTNAAPTQDYVNGDFGQNGNTIFNSFRNVLLTNIYSGIIYSGSFNGTVCTIDTTDNTFDDVREIQVKFGIAATVCNDSNHFTRHQYYGITSGVCLTIGNDGVAADHDNYQLYFDGLCSSYQTPTANTLTFITSNGSSWGHHIHIQTDDVFSLTGGVGPYGACVSQANSTVITFADLELPGICNASIPADGAPNGFAGGVSAAILGGNTMYFQSSAGVAAAPAYSFFNDTTNGVYRAAAGFAAFSKNLRVDGHLLGGANSPTLSACGTSPAFAGTASDTAGRVTVGTGPPTACTLTFGAAFVIAPVCTITPVGAAQSATFISANSTTAITWSWGTATAGQQFNYTCLALPGG